MTIPPDEVFSTWAMRGQVTLSPTMADILVGNPKFTHTHDFVRGDVVRRSSITEHAKARSDSPANIGHGLAIVVHVEGTTYWIVRRSNNHTLYLPGHNLGAYDDEIGLSHALYGKLAAMSTIPLGRRIYLGFVLGPDHIHWEPEYVRY